MSTLDWILLLGIGLLLLTLISFSIFYSFEPSKNIYLDPKTDTLQKNISIDHPKIKDFLRLGEGSLSVFIYLDAVQRTPVYKDVSKPLDDSGRQLSSTERTKNYSENFNIFSLGTGASSSFTFKQYIQTISKGATSEIQIRTVNSTGTSETPNIESFPIPAIPLQTWTNVTIVRSGRRFTIYYNQKLVASFRTKYYPISQTNPWYLGDPNSAGYFAFPMASNTAFTEQEVADNIRKVADTRNQPILPKPSISNIFGSLKGCPDGVFCFQTQAVPENGVNQWSSPFA